MSTSRGIDSLVIAPQWIGDAVMTEPLMRRLAARGERLTVGALPWVAPVYRAMPQVAEVIEFPFQHGGLQFKARRQLARLLGGRFDIAYVCPNSLKSALLPFLASIPKRVGYLGEARVGLITHRLKNPPKGTRPPMVAFYSALSGDTDIANDRPQLHADAAEAASALTAMGLTRGGYYVFAPGAEFGPAKRWPAAHYSELAGSLDLPVVLLGSAKESDLCGRDRCAGECRAAGQVPEFCRKNLTGPCIHCDFSYKKHSKQRFRPDARGGRLRCAADRDFWLEQPLHTPPLNDKATVVWLKDDATYLPPLDCAPCFERDCPLGHTRCLNDVSAARVLAEVAGEAGTPLPLA